ncbi:FAD-binding oxidoreductase [Gymnodinialimonas sp. 2305UL16-5]|uniref:FAD-binding oxidoreductase n=1 Tax=Gymnodinialimonas mytili TaxID=3126503 RepID=UPI0030AD575D
MRKTLPLWRNMLPARMHSGSSSGERCDTKIMSNLDIFPPETVVTDPDILSGRLTDFRSKYTGKAAALLLPRHTDDVRAIVTAARANKVPLVPQGGNTSYCGGATPDTSARAVLVGFDRMTAIREIDASNRSMTVEAGVILQEAQDAADSAGLMLPLSLGARGSCRIGGNIGTNAGGLNVLRYGMTRSLVLGLEVVLANGKLLNTLSPIRKDNAGLRTQDLFVGTEGTLGIVTAATLALAPRPVRQATALLAVRALEDLPGILDRLRTVTGDSVSAFEYVAAESFDLVTRLWGRSSHPLEADFRHAALVEVATSADMFDVEAALESGFIELMEEGIVIDGALASSGAQRDALWAARETIPEAEVHQGGSIKHDVSVRTSQVPDLVAQALRVVTSSGLDARPSIYGHVGDGNVHLNLLAGENTTLAQIEESISPKIYDIVSDLGGSFSAEYGIGQAKHHLDERYGDPVRREVARAVKHAMDPDSIFNPGKGTALL